jgi:maltoporin
MMRIGDWVVLTGSALLLATDLTAVEVMKSDESTLGFHGYVRHGFGVSDKGDKQSAFGLQGVGAASKYRLGNENDTDVELAVDYRYYYDGKGNDGHVQLYVMTDGYATNEDDFKLDRIPQLYASFNNMVADGVNVWVGRRYYDRKDIHMNDHFWLNTGQHADAGAAAGVEGLSVGDAKLKVAVIQAIDNHAADTVDPDRNTMTLFYDARLTDIEIGTGKLSFWAMYADRSSNPDASLFGDDGYGIGGWYDLKAGETITNTTALLYKEGAAVPRHDFNHNPLINDPAILDVSFIELNNNFLIEAQPEWSMQWAVVYRTTEQTDTTYGSYDIDWYSTGVRPIIYFSRHLSLATEIGYDYIDNEGMNKSGGLIKGTVALQLAIEPGYYKRPVLRLFYTAASWDDDFKGDVGGTAYAEATRGYSTGVQMEWWW